jgi:hypothetical protein
MAVLWSTVLSKSTVSPTILSKATNSIMRQLSGNLDPDGQHRVCGFDHGCTRQDRNTLPTMEIYSADGAEFVCVIALHTCYSPCSHGTLPSLAFWRPYFLLQRAVHNNCIESMLATTDSDSTQTRLSPIREAL